ncbi:uncharacterized protein LOC141849056 isoform X3 [Brevipalpus obovatus]|uniref:uncharacterized protein LOC141849056 isoform X3 n=1 Tax=Brevipalpus obovatus TaxID=246614 RepID=UPI003D9F42D6
MCDTFRCFSDANFWLLGRHHFQNHAVCSYMHLNKRTKSVLINDIPMEDSSTLSLTRIRTSSTPLASPISMVIGDQFSDLSDEHDLNSGSYDDLDPLDLSLNLITRQADLGISMNSLISSKLHADGGKKSYLASIESLADALDDDSDYDDETRRSSNCGLLLSCSNQMRVINTATNTNTAITSTVTTTTTSSTAISNNNNNNANCNIVTREDEDKSAIHHDHHHHHHHHRVLHSYGHLPNYWDPNLTHMERVIMEIVETERTYVQDLHEIIEGYLIYFKNLPQSQQENMDKRSFISDDQLCNLFGNIEDIFRFNSSFLSQLEDCGMNPGGIAKCFVNHSKGFDVYTQYCTNYPRTVSLLTDLMKKRETAEAFRERQLHLNHSLPLGSYLLKPVQRILKYHLLLQNIVKDNVDECGELDDIKDALSVMTNIASHINEMKRKHEHAVRVQEIQSLLLGWQEQDLTTYGELVSEASFRMLGAKASRHLLLFDKMLLITKKKEDGTLSYKAHIMCSNLMLIESIKGEPLCFQTIPFDLPRVQYTFLSRNIDQKREWCLHLKRLMMDSFAAPIPSTAKKIVLGLGQSLSLSSSESSSKCHGSGRKALSAPEYLERRKQERRKSDTISHSLHKGFKLRKSLKKIHPFDLHNGSRRGRSASHDETAMNLIKDDEGKDRRCSLGILLQSGLEEEPNSVNISADSDKLNGGDILMAKTSTPTTATTTTTTASNSSLTPKESISPIFERGSPEERKIGLRRTGSRCLKRFASDCIKRASISEAFGDEYVQLYFGPSACGTERKSEHSNSNLSNLKDISASLRGRYGLSNGLSSGSSELSMTSMGSIPPEDAVNCICRAYRQLSIRSNSSAVRPQTQSTDANGRLNPVNCEYLADDTLIPCLCGSNCEKSSSLSRYTASALSSSLHHHYNQHNIHPSNYSTSSRGDDSGIGSISSRSSYSARTSTPLSSGSSELSMASSATSEDYRNLNATMAILDNPNSVVRRVQSFTGNVKAKGAIIQHTLSFRHSPALDLPQCNLHKHRISTASGMVSSSGAGNIGTSNATHHTYSFSSISSRDSSTTRLASSTSLEELMSPTSPAAWLKKQEQHFPAACKKGGSLPRSFETTAFASRQPL